jgi:hypothetical protein
LQQIWCHPHILDTWTSKCKRIWEKCWGHNMWGLICVICMMKRRYFIREVHWISEQPAILTMEFAFAGTFYRCLSCYDQVPTFLWIGTRICF